MNERDANADHTERHALAGRGLSTNGHPAAALRTRWLLSAVKNPPARSVAFSSSDPGAAVATPVDSGLEDAAWNARLSEVEADFGDGGGEEDSQRNPGNHGCEESPRAWTQVTAVPFEDTLEPHAMQAAQWTDSRTEAMRAVSASMSADPLGGHDDHIASNAMDDPASFSTTADRSRDWPIAAKSGHGHDVETDMRAPRSATTSASRATSTNSDKTSRRRESDEEVRAALGRRAASGDQTLLRRANAERFAPEGGAGSEPGTLAGEQSTDAYRWQASDAGSGTTRQAERPGQSADILRRRASSRRESDMHSDAAMRDRAGWARVAEMGMPDAGIADTAAAERSRHAPASAMRTSPIAGNVMTRDTSANAPAYRNPSRRFAPLDAASFAALLAPPPPSGPSVTIDRVQVTVQAPPSKPVSHPSAAAAPTSPAATTTRSGAGSSGYRSPWASYFTRQD
jgi:hypothetical protein